MSGKNVLVKYFFTDENKDDSLASVEVTIGRMWMGTAHESLYSVAKRIVEGMKGQEFVTVVQGYDSAVTFRRSNLQSIEYDVVQD